MTAACLPRSRENLIAAVAEVAPETNPQLRRRDVTGDGIPETFCNVFVRLALALLGIIIPPLLVNDLAEWFEGPKAKADGWVNVKTMAEAEQLVEKGRPVVAVFKAASTSCEPCGGTGQVAAGACPGCSGTGKVYHHGHIALGVPQPIPPSKVLGMRIAQAGARNFSNGAFTDGFGRRTVRIFTHP